VTLRHWLVVATVATGCSWVYGQTPAFSLEAQQRLFGGGSAVAETLARRSELVAEGEALLAAGDAAGALRAFESAASIVHAADVELGLVRSHMQAGDYRRALTFGAHAAGAHRELPGGMVLYAWLLHVGGQRPFAKRMLDEWIVRAPSDAALLQARRELSNPSPRADGVLALPPIRIGPSDASTPVPAGASVVGNAVLLPSGRQAVVPAQLVAGARRVWIRNGLGRTSAATPSVRQDVVDLILLELDSALDRPVDWLAAPAPPPAGSPSYLIEYGLSGDAAPAWPILHAGFFGRPREAPSMRPLGIDAPSGPRGGPVFDRYGRVAGIAMTAADGSGWLLPVSSFVVQPDAPGSAVGTAQPTTPLALDALYEAALRMSAQLIVER
jgi:hypothetical protein